MKRSALTKTFFLMAVLSGCGQKPFSAADFIPFDGEVHPNHQGHILMAETFLAQMCPLKKQIYCALGDSVTTANAKSFPYCYPGMLSKRMGFHETRVLGIGGANTFRVQFQELPSVPEGADLVTLFVGLNDLVSTNQWGSPDALHPFGCGIVDGTAYSYEFKKRVQIILNTLKKKKAKQILIANIYDFTNGHGFSKWGWPAGTQVLDQFNERIAELAQENQIGLVDLHKAFSTHTELYFNNPRWDQPPRRWGELPQPGALPQKDQIRHSVFFHPNNGVLAVLFAQRLSVFQRNA